MEALLPSGRRRTVCYKSVWRPVVLILGSYVGLATGQDTASPTLTSSLTVTAPPTFLSTISPEPTVTPLPSFGPSSSPTAEPSITPQPTATPTNTIQPSSSPTSSPAPSITSQPTGKPTVTQTELPSFSPSLAPSDYPSKSPRPTISDAPSVAPTITPVPTLSISPSHAPSISFPPTESVGPSFSPSVSIAPTTSSAPSFQPTERPSTPNPTKTPKPTVSFEPSFSPTNTFQPSFSPTLSKKPSTSPLPSFSPSVSLAPSISDQPSSSPTEFPTGEPSVSPSTGPPSAAPSEHPSEVPSYVPSSTPTNFLNATAFDFPKNTMTVAGLTAQPRRDDLWENVTDAHIQNFWDNFVSVDYRINVIMVRTVQIDQVSSGSTGSKTTYTQSIQFNVITILGENGTLPENAPPDDAVLAEVIASRPFTHDFQTYADSLFAIRLASNNWLDLEDIQVNIGSTPDNTGKVVGIIVGVAAAFIIILFGVYYYQKKKRQKAILASQMEFQGFVGGDLPSSMNEEVVIPQDMPPVSPVVTESNHKKQDTPPSAQKDGASSEMDPYSISANSFHGQENVSELSFHADPDVPYSDDLPNSIDAIDEYNDDDMHEGEDDNSFVEDEEEQPAPAFAMQISPIDDLEDMDM